MVDVLTNVLVINTCSLCGLSAFLVYLAVNDETPNFGAKNATKTPRARSVKQ